MLHLIYGTVLGLIQGLTEFLPISSSGHLFIVQFFAAKRFFFTKMQYLAPFANESMPLLYIVLLHIATLCAVLFFTRKIIKKMFIASVQFCIIKTRKKKQTAEQDAYVHLTYMVCLSTLTTLPMGLLLKNTVVNASLDLVMTGFFITALLLCLPSFLKMQQNTNTNTSIESYANIRISKIQAILIGLIQGCAVLPGISRSGSTIVVGVLLGLSFMHATYFSFILSIPTILASFISSVLKSSSSITQSLPLSFTLVSMGSAFLSGLLGLMCIVRFAKRKKLWVFSLYLLSLNILLLWLQHTALFTVHVQ